VILLVSVKLVNIVKKFGKVEAIKGVSLHILDGEFFSILGPSGCGKTTLLRIIAGLEKPTEGRVYFNEHDVTNLAAEARDVAMVFQFYALYPTTVFNNIAIPLFSRKYSKSEVTKRVTEAARLVGLEKLLNVHVDRLSVVDKQRVALARAIAKEPQVYLLDEPLTILDPVSRVIIRSELKRIQKQLKQTVIYVTHDQIEALTLADRIAVMNFGVVEQIGSPHEVYNLPTSTYVGWFLGEPGMNFIEAVVSSNGSILLGNKVIFQNQHITRELINQGLEKVLLGFRAENTVLSREPVERDLSREVVIEGVLKVIEFFGTHYVLDIESGGSELKVKLNPIDFNSLGLRENDKVTVVISFDKVLFFHPDSGKRILLGEKE
jgi:ABC-type sugar transport system ATPase subunit